MSSMGEETGKQTRSSSVLASRRAGNGVNKMERMRLSDASSPEGGRGQQAQASSSSGGARAGASSTGSRRIKGLPPKSESLDFVVTPTMLSWNQIVGFLTDWEGLQGGLVAQEP